MAHAAERIGRRYGMSVSRIAGPAISVVRKARRVMLVDADWAELRVKATCMKPSG